MGVSWLEEEEEEERLEEEEERGGAGRESEAYLPLLPPPNASHASHTPARLNSTQLQLHCTAPLQFHSAEDWSMNLYGSALKCSGATPVLHYT